MHCRCQASILEFSEQAARRRTVEPGTEKRQRFARCITGDDLVQMMIGSVLIAPRLPGHQRRWRSLGMQRARAQLRTESLRQRFQVFLGLRAGQAQCHLPALIEALMKFAQRLLKGLTFHWQAVAIARMKAAQRMISGQALQQGYLLLRLGILRPGHELRMQHFALAQLVVNGQARVRQHVGQAHQPFVEGRHRQLEKELGDALPGAGIHLPAMTPYVGHQPFAYRKTLSSQKQHVL